MGRWSIEAARWAGWVGGSSGQLEGETCLSAGEEEDDPEKWGWLSFFLMLQVDYKCHFQQS